MERLYLFYGRIRKVIGWFNSCFSIKIILLYLLYAFFLTFVIYNKNIVFIIFVGFRLLCLIKELLLMSLFQQKLMQHTILITRHHHLHLYHTIHRLLHHQRPGIILPRPHKEIFIINENHRQKLIS